MCTYTRQGRSSSPQHHLAEVLPVVDVLVRLARLYQTPLSEHRAKTIIMALVGSVTPTAVSYTVGGLLWGVMPLAGLIAAMGSGAGN